MKLQKARARQVLPQKVRLDVLHNVGVFLNPCIKGLFFLTPTRKKAALEKMKQLINEVITQQPQTGNPENSIETADVNDDEQYKGELATKKLKIDDFSELCDRDCDDGKRNELAKYVNMKVPKNTKMMQFWIAYSKILPNMFKVACRVLCIPASSAASKRVISTAGRVLEKRRTIYSLS